ENFQRPHQRRLRLHRHHMRAEPTEASGANTDMRADIEDEIAGSHQFAVEAIHRRSVRAVAIIHAKRTRDAQEPATSDAPGIVPGAHGSLTRGAATSRSQAA